MIRLLALFMTLMCTSAYSPGAWAKETAEKPATVSNVDNRINSIRLILKRILEELARARDANDMKRVNCLQLKVNIIKGLLKAAEKANIVFLEATYGRDAATAEAYGKKINMYTTGANEVAQSMDECSSGDAATEGSSLVYIRPAEPDFVVSDTTSPWDGTGEGGGADGYPVVPPASSFR